MTVMVAVAVPVLPSPSVVENVITFAPTGSTAAASLSMTRSASTASVAEAPAKNDASTAASREMAPPPVSTTVMSFGGVTVGAEVSPTVTCRVTEAWLPAASAALKVTSVVPIGKTPGASFATTTVPSTTSVATADASSAAIVLSVAGVPEAFSASTVTSSPTEISGGVASPTRTTSVAVALLSWLSKAVKVTTVDPSGNSDGASLLTSTGPSTRSFATTAASAAAITGFVASVPEGLSASTATSSLPVMTGAEVSTTVTEAVAVPVLPSSSVALNVTTVVPSGNTEGASFVTSRGP